MPEPRAASHPSYTRVTRVLVASFISLLPPPSSAPLLSPRRRRGDQVRIECETGLTGESTMGGEKETFDISDLNASLPAAAAGNLRPADTVSHTFALEFAPNRSALYSWFTCSPQRRGPRWPRQCP